MDFGLTFSENKNLTSVILNVNLPNNSGYFSANTDIQMILFPISFISPLDFVKNKVSTNIIQAKKY